MKWLVLALLMGGSALAGGGGPLPTSSASGGPAFDLAWVDAALTQQVMLSGLDELEARYGRRSGLKKWASADGEERKAALERLLALKNQIKPQEARTVPVVISGGSPQDFAHFDGFFLAEYGKASAQLSVTARLGLNKSQHPALKREAAALLKFEVQQFNALKDLK